MARATVGAGKTYATLSAAQVEPAGTILELFDAVFSGALFTVKAFRYKGMIANQGVKITSSGLTMNLAGGSIVENLEIEGTGTLIVIQMGSGLWVDCDVHGDSGNAAQGAINASSNGLLINTAGHSNPTGFGINAASCHVINCSAANSQKGFGGTNVYENNLAGNNTGADFPGTGSGEENVSEDGTAIGNLAVTGFDPDDWTDKTGADLTIRDAVKATTKAFFSDSEPNPAAVNDAFGNQRKAGQVYAGFHDPDPIVAAVQPGKPLMGTLVPAAGQITIPVTVAAAGDEVFARVRPDGTEPWTAESGTFSRIGNGNIVFTGLIDGTRYEVAIYASINPRSDWDTDFAVAGAVVAGAPATRPLAKYKVAIRDLFLNSTNLLDWIQTVDSGGTTAGRVILGYSAVSTPPDIATKGPKVFISAKSFSADNAGTATLYVATVEIIAEIVWAMDHLDNETFSEEENFIDLLLNEACGLGLALESTLEGSIESINLENIESDDGTEGQGRRERRTVIGFLITYPMPT